MSAERTITVITKDNCQACTATKRRLDKRGIEYQEVNLNGEYEGEWETVLLDLALHLGYRQAPVVLVHDGETWTDTWSGYRPDLLEKL